MEESNLKLNEELENNEQEIVDIENIEPTIINQEQDLQNLLVAEKDKYMRLFAEFENYKKRISKERIELFKTAGQEILVSLLPVLDDFERCIKELNKSSETELTKGIELINTKLSETLKNKGLEKMEVTAGDVFDLDKHEAITSIPAPTEELKDKIIDVIEYGYLLGNKVIRYAKVIIGK